MTTGSIVTSSTSSFLQQFIDKITLVPNDVNRFLRLIRFLDIRLQKLQKILSRQQKQLLTKCSTLKDKDKKLLYTSFQSSIKQNPQFNTYTVKKLSSSQNLPTQLQDIFNEYIKVLNIQKKVLGYSKEKSDIGTQLAVEVKQYFQILEKEVRIKIIKQLRAQDINNSNFQQIPINDLLSHMKKKKQQSLITTSTLLLNKKRQDFFYDSKQDKFCYCGQSSYGDMVFCQNLYCQREWFHLNCIKQSNLPEKWYCNQCQKMKDKTKNNISRSYFSA